MSAPNINSSLDAALKSATKPTASTPRMIPTTTNLGPLTAEIPFRKEGPRSPENSGEEQALEWHEVIELQAFSERKAWIEEKTKLLEQMPPIQVFVGLDVVRESAEEVPGLPTREELKQWVIDHDKIEKETEMFDSGELRKLKKFTKAAAQRNFSPADTDIIEITLTTIYALDKLLHLLRERSDNLELLSDRLAWEEKRIGCWVELRSIVADLKHFLDTRARWSPSVYDRDDDEADNTPANEISAIPLPTLRRKGSMSSLMSTASDSTVSTLALSRGERFKLAETLSRDAAQFASRVLSLRHSKVTAAGKALDKLIDDSRKPVPDELLDEQDKLEDKVNNEMEDVGKFVMGVVMQWKKADEIYVETAKDKSTAQTLLEEIEMAKLSHPTSRRDTSFLSRSTTLLKRLKMRENPSSPVNFFPRPSHRLFPDQDGANVEIAHILSAELATAHEQAYEAERAAKEYHGTLEKVKRVENVLKTASDLTDQLKSLAHRLETGVESTAGDGSPPTLSSEACLHSNSHSVFLAHAPQLLDIVSEVEQTANQVTLAGRAALAALPREGIDPQFVRDSVAVFDQLASYRTSAIKSRSSVALRIETLRKCRGIWSSMAETFDKLDNIRHDVMEGMQQQMYKPQANQDAALLTPESPSSPLSSFEISVQQANEQLEVLASALNTQVVSPLSEITPSIGQGLEAYLSDCSSGLSQSLDELNRLTQSWTLVQRQASEMAIVSDETHALQMRSEHLKLQYEDSTRDVLLGNLSGADLLEKEKELETMAELLTQDVQSFQDKLSLRIPIVGSGERSSAPRSAPNSHRRRFSISTGFSLEAVRQAAQAGLPFDAAALNRAVRADANSYSIMLAGEVETLSRHAHHFRLAQQARAIDVSVRGVLEGLHEACVSLDGFQSLLDSHEPPVSLANLLSISQEVDQLYRDKGQSLAASCISTRDLLERMETQLASRDPSAEATSLALRRRAVEEAEEKFNGWRESVEVLSEQLSDMQHAERMRLDAEARARADEEERLRLAEEHRRIAEEERLRLAEEERVRREEEEKLRREEEKRLCFVEEERLRVAEQERLRLADEERLRLVEQERLRSTEEERLRLERKETLERQRAEEEARAKTEGEARAQERLTEGRACVGLGRNLAEVAAKDSQHEFVVLSSALSTAEGIAQSAPKPANGKGRRRPTHEADVFGISRSDSMNSNKLEKDTNLQTRVVSMRKRLRSLNINEIARPSRDSASALPSQDLVFKLEKQLETLQAEAKKLPFTTATAPYVDAELRSLRSELDASLEMLAKIRTIADFGVTLQSCDDLLSDLLEHVDSYPAPPMATLSSAHGSDTSRPPEAQMSDRLAFTQGLVEELVSKASLVVNDSRIMSERNRITQTWEELQAMGADRVNGHKSRPPSALSSGRVSRSSNTPSPVAGPSFKDESKKPASYSKLSAAPSGIKYLAPPPHTRRSTSGSSAAAHIRSASRASVASTNRSVSGPTNTTPISSRLHSSTFASRQRSSSISSTIATIIESPKPMTPPLLSTPRVPGSRPRARTGQSVHVGSPLVPATPRSQSRSSVNISRSSVSANRSTWSRAPRQSFPNVPKSPPPRKPASTQKTPYVPNPQNKLDMAVGDVVNSLPVNINIEVVAETWKDQSGKYWIGDDDPRLCFCRILRSQTVMVRVGGGWSELSKFIKEHFADAFRVLPLPESPPPKSRAQEEKWVSSATLAQALSDKAQSPPLPPQTPEPRLPFIPSFALSTPSGTSPRTIKSSSPGSPQALHPIQFIRRAERESLTARPDTPSKGPRSTSSLSNNPRQPIWRP
ncbi:hypothetical protein BC835DRAFT_628774 [Cytidiella melzeri]|nr:hypothetical protein BC835DRAFT_628774 [Cytidiella melzeri]